MLANCVCSLAYRVNDNNNVAIPKNVMKDRKTLRNNVVLRCFGSNNWNGASVGLIHRFHRVNVQI